MEISFEYQNSWLEYIFRKNIFFLSAVKKKSSGHLCLAQWPERGDEQIVAEQELCKFKKCKL